MPTDTTVYHNFEVEATRRLKDLRNYFPRYMHDSEVIQAFVTAWGEEVTSRVFDTLLAILRNIRPTTADSFAISEWETMLDIEHNDADTIELTRAKILNKTFKGPRTRLVDIADVVRLYLIGPLTFTTSQVTDTTIIPVGSITGYIVSQIIFIGSVRRTIVEIDPALNVIVVSSPITAHAFSLVSEQEVLIEVGSAASPNIDYDDASLDYDDAATEYGGPNPAAYDFNIFVEVSLILDVIAMQNAILAARPAHLGFTISTGTIEYDDASLDYDDEDTPYDGWGSSFST